jgi:hypothetical protein
MPMALPRNFERALESFGLDADTASLRREVWGLLAPQMSRIPAALSKKEPVGGVDDRLSQERQGVSALHRRRADLDRQLPRARSDKRRAVQSRIKSRFRA